jgi:hypothetical protein
VGIRSSQFLRTTGYLNRDSDKIIYEREQREFDAAIILHVEGTSSRNQNYTKFLNV